LSVTKKKFLKAPGRPGCPGEFWNLTTGPSLGSPTSSSWVCIRHIPVTMHADWSHHVTEQLIYYFTLRNLLNFLPKFLRGVQEVCKVKVVVIS